MSRLNTKEIEARAKRKHVYYAKRKKQKELLDYMACKEFCQKFNPYIANKEYMVFDGCYKLEKIFKFVDAKREIHNDLGFYCGVGWGAPRLSLFKHIKVFKKIEVRV